MDREELYRDFGATVDRLGDSLVGMLRTVESAPLQLEMPPFATNVNRGFIPAKQRPPKGTIPANT